MKIKNSITLKLFTILTVSLTILIGAIIYTQLFVVSRLYMTTDYMNNRLDSLSNELNRISIEYTYELTSIPTNETAGSIIKSISSSLPQLEKANDAYLLVLDENFKIAGITSKAKRSLGTFCLNSISKSVKNGTLDYGKSFRVRGLFNLPSKYIAVSNPVSLYKTSDKIAVSKPYGYIVFVTREVYTSGSSSILRKYVAYIFIASVLLIILMSGIFSYIITRPIININRSALKMIDMDFSQKCYIKSEDEIGNLANSLNFLSSKLDTTLSELYDANEKLKKDLDIQRELDQMKKDFIAAVTHEFKTPITLIKGYTESIKDNVAKENEREMALDIINNEVDKLDKLVLDLIDISRMEASSYHLELGEFYIDGLLGNISKKYEYIMKENEIDFVSDIRYNDALVCADSFRIEQVITNFLNNAISNTKQNGRIMLMSERNNDIITVSVENEGKHIADGELDKIWEKFYRVDKSRSKKSGGMGLGLAICKTILDNHSYKYGVENTDTGVKFYFDMKAV